MKTISISQSAKRRGFTLIELLVVILILGILAALIVPKVIGQSDKAKVGAATSDLASISSMLDQFRLDCDRYPTTEEGLDALGNPPAGTEGKWKGPYNKKPIPLDPWKNAYVYKCPGNSGQDSYIIMSYGADGQEGGTGYNADIVEASN